MNPEIVIIRSRDYSRVKGRESWWVDMAGPSTAAKPTDAWIVSGSRYTETDTGEVWVYDEDGGWSQMSGQGAAGRIEAITSTELANGNVIETVGIPPYVSDMTEYPEYSLQESGWYVFSRINAPEGVTVDANTTVTGAAGSIITPGEDYVDVAVRFDVTAMSQKVTIDWGTSADTYIFKATDLAVRNLDYRTTFYVYDADPYVTWEYALTTDTAFVADKAYYTKDGDVYTKAEVTTGEAVPADTYYNHSKCIISGMARNITYKLDDVIDCPMEFILPVIEDETHGCWFEIRCIHAGEYSMTLTPPSADVKIATEHTQKETKGINMIDLHYTYINGVKLWRFMNTHSSIPEAAAAATE